MPEKFVDKVDQRILEMLNQKKLRRQNGLGELPLVDKILQSNEVKPPKVPKLPKA